VTKALTTNGSGFYSAEALPSGDYRIIVKREGFQTGTIDNIHLNPGQRREVSPQLAVGSVGESVTV